MNIEFVASFSPIVEDIAGARRFYGEELGIEFEGGEEDYAFTEQLDGVKHLGLWPLAQAADACFGTRPTTREPDDCSLGAAPPQRGRASPRFSCAA